LRAWGRFAGIGRSAQCLSGDGALRASANALQAFVQFRKKTLNKIPGQMLQWVRYRNGTLDEKKLLDYISLLVQ
jgi:hypothetical protein